MKKITMKKRLKEAKWDGADDAPTLTKSFLEKAALMPPITDPQWSKKMHELSKGKKTKEKTIHIDADTDKWFSSFGKRSEELMNVALRVYMLAHDSPRG